MCRDVALKFNQMYCGVGNRVLPEDHFKSGGVFPIPKGKVGRIGRLVGIDGKQKMSKSLGNAIFLYDSEKDVQKKINKIVTGRASSTSPIDPESPLVQYIEAFLPRERADEIEALYASGKEVMDGHIKQEVGAAINALIEPMRQRRAKLDGEAGDARAIEVIRAGVKRANVVAEETLYAAKRAMQVDFGTRTLTA